MAHLSTHVLDTSRSVPAAATWTDDNGRAELAGEGLPPAVYALFFSVAGYHVPPYAYSTYRGA